MMHGSFCTRTKASALTRMMSLTIYIFGSLSNELASKEIDNPPHLYPLPQGERKQSWAMTADGDRQGEKKQGWAMTGDGE